MDTYSKAFNANFPLVSCMKNKTNHQPWFDTDLYEYSEKKIKLLKNTLRKKHFNTRLSLIKLGINTTENC